MGRVSKYFSKKKKIQTANRHIKRCSTLLITREMQIQTTVVYQGYPLQYSGLENSKDNTVLGVAKSRIQLSNLHFHFSHLLQWVS